MSGSQSLLQVVSTSTFGSEAASPLNSARSTTTSKARSGRVGLETSGAHVSRAKQRMLVKLAKLEVEEQQNVVDELDKFDDRLVECLSARPRLNDTGRQSMPWILPTPSSEEDAKWSAPPRPPPPKPKVMPTRRPKITVEGVDRAFKTLDANGNGVLSRAEVIKAVRESEEVRTLLGLPAQIQDETREVFENIFQMIDVDGSKSIDRDEFQKFFLGGVKLDRPNAGAAAALANNLLLMEGPAPTASR